jgi:hypothetical protein
LFKALVLSAIVISVSIATNNGYKRLLKEMDSYVSNSYGVLSEMDSPELKSAGNEVVNGYSRHRLQQ